MEDNITKEVRTEHSDDSSKYIDSAVNFVNAIMKYINSSDSENSDITQDTFVDAMNDIIMSEKIDIACEVDSLGLEVDGSEDVINLLDLLCAFIPDELREAESFAWMNEKDRTKDRLYSEELLKVYCTIDNTKSHIEHIHDYCSNTEGDSFGIVYEAKSVLDFMRYIYRYTGMKRVRAYGVAILASILFTANKSLHDIADTNITQIAIDVSSYLDEVEYVSALISALFNIVKDIDHTERLAKSALVPERDLCRIRESYNIKMLDSFKDVVNKGVRKEYTDFEVCCFSNVKDNNEVYDDTDLVIHSGRVEYIASSIMNMLCKINNNMLIFVGDNYSEYYDVIKGAWKILRDTKALDDIDLDEGPLMEVDTLFFSSLKEYGHLVQSVNNMIAKIHDTGRTIFIPNMAELIAATSVPFSLNPLYSNIFEAAKGGDIRVIMCISKSMFESQGYKMDQMTSAYMCGCTEDELKDELICVMKWLKGAASNSVVYGEDEIHYSEDSMSVADYVEYAMKTVGEYDSIGSHEYTMMKRILEESLPLGRRYTDDGGIVVELCEDNIDSVIEDTYSVVVKSDEDEKEMLKNLESMLGADVIGQDEAVGVVSRAVRRNLVGIRDKKRPVGVFMFVGPTGVGKTYLCKKLAERVFMDKEDVDMLKLDMSEYSEKHEVSKLFGAPPGYVGYDKGGQLTEWVRNHPRGVVLFDEIEKANPAVFDVLLQIMDDGVLTDGQGVKADFKNSLIVMTSNAGYGADALGKGKIVGFSRNTDDTISATERELIVMNELEHTFKPEFLNRIDNVVVFNELTRDNALDIARIRLNSVVKVLENKGIIAEFDDSVIKAIVDKGYSEKYGARNINRVVQNIVEDGITDMILSGEIPERSDECKSNYFKFKMSDTGLCVEGV